MRPFMRRECCRSARHCDVIDPTAGQSAVNGTKLNSGSLLLPCKRVRLGAAGCCLLLQVVVWASATLFRIPDRLYSANTVSLRRRGGSYWQRTWMRMCDNMTYLVTRRDSNTYSCSKRQASRRAAQSPRTRQKRQHAFQVSTPHSWMALPSTDQLRAIL